MIPFENIKKQLELSKKNVIEFKNQNAIFEEILHEAVKGAPEEHKAELDKIRIMSAKAINYAKAGKLKDAQELIKDFKNVGKSNK